MIDLVCHGLRSSSVRPVLTPPVGRQRLRELTGDLRQLACVRRITLDDGAERGTRALAFSTGGGLDFWVLSDRSMDIGPLWWEGVPIAWQHPNGYSSPHLHSAESDNQSGVQRALSGFLVTCGLENVRQPRAGHPLHGRLPLSPARLTAYGEDWDAPTPFLFAVGETVLAHLQGPSFRIRRRIEAPIGGNSLTLEDEVENIGLAATEMMILYHTNFGFPAVGDDTSVMLDGSLVLQTSDLGEATSVHCHEVLGARTTHTELNRPASGPWRGLKVEMHTRSAELPFVQIWSDPRPTRNILAIEPSNCARAEDGTSLPGTLLQPGETWSTRLTYRFTTPEREANVRP